MKNSDMDSTVGGITAAGGRSLSLLAAASLLLAAGTAIGGSTTYTVSVNSETFATGTPLSEGIASIVVPEGGCGTATVIADPSFTVGTTTYEFLFWNIDARPYTTAEVSFTTLCTAASTATAWFLPLPSGGPEAPQVDTYAFSLNQNAFIPSTPIQSVTNGAWSGGNSTVVYTSGTSPVTITALTTIPPYGRFTDWETIAFPPPAPLANGSSITVPADGSESAIAFYGIPVPDPCEPLRLELQSCFEADLGKACPPIGHSLDLCEAYWGEN